MRTRAGQETPLVSVIAVNFNGADILGRWARSVRASDYTNLEVLAVERLL